jgi:hypothetical protein
MSGKNKSKTAKDARTTRRREPVRRSLKELRDAKAKVISERAPSHRSAVLARGNIDCRETPENGTRTVADFRDITLVWAGTYAALAAEQPNKSDVYLEYPNTPVVSSTLVRRPGDMGRLTIQLSDRVEAETTQVIKERWEINMQQIEKDLLQHPYISTDADYANIVEDVRLWDNGGDIKLQAQYKYVDTDGAEKTLAGKALQVATKMQRGQTGYLIFAPVVSKVSDYQGRPDTAAAGTINTPDESIAGYVYLKTGDRLVQKTDNKWERTEEWTGADSWDIDLYTAGSGWNAAEE